MALILPNTIANLQPADGDKLEQNFTTIETWGNNDAITRDGSTAMTGPLLLAGPPTQPNQAASKAYVDSQGFISEMRMYAGDTEPTNWMFCRGQTLSRSTYASLFAVVGTRFGIGDNVSTFNLPDMRARYAVGNNPGGLDWGSGVGEAYGSRDSFLPAHIHDLHNHNHTSAGYTTTDGAHEHTPLDGGLFIVQRGDAAVSLPYPGAGLGFVSPSITSTNGPHAHYVSLLSGGPNVDSTGTAGASTAAATNLPPSMSVNFIIKVA